jgi:hypothetical protein
LTFQGGLFTRSFRRARKAPNYSFRSKKPLPKPRKITQAIELSILTLRKLFKWGPCKDKAGIDLPTRIYEEGFKGHSSGSKNI